MIYLELILSFFRIGALSFGGGYAAMPLIQSECVLRRGWIDAETFADLITLSEMTPGPIALNSATFVGMRVAGVPGALTATVSLLIPSLLIVSALSYLYAKYQSLSMMQGALNGLRPVVLAMILSAGVTLFAGAVFREGSFRDTDLLALAAFGLSLFVLRKWKPGPIPVIAGCAAIGAVCHLFGI